MTEDKEVIDNNNIENVNYCLLKKLGILDMKEHKKIIVPNLMDLKIAVLYTDNKTMLIALTHNFIQNNDLIANPDIEIMLHKDTEKAEPLACQKDMLGVYQRVYDNDGKCNTELKEKLNIYLNKWLMNLKRQGYY